MKTRQTADFEFWSGRLKRWFELHPYPASEGGLPVYFRDTTERRQMQEKLRDTEQRLSRLAESNVMRINDELLRMIGRSREEVRAATSASLGCFNGKEFLGTGLGLATCNVLSGNGDGSTFHFMLPMP